MKGIRGRGTAVMQRTPQARMFFLTHNAPPSLSVSFLSVPPRPYTSSGPMTNISRQDEEANRRWGWRWWWGWGGGCLPIPMSAPHLCGFDSLRGAYMVPVSTVLSISYDRVRFSLPPPEIPPGQRL